MISYARSGSHLAKIISRYLGEGWCLYYRSYSCDSKREAIEMQNNLLDKFKYKWNIQLNLDD